MARPSDLTDADEEYLKSQYAQYRRTPGSEKESFRVLCAKHIMRSRDLDLEHVYTLDLFNAKVRNWFQNNAPVKKVRLPMHINNAFHPERVWGMMHQDEIRTSLQDSPPEDVDADTPYVVLWNARRKEMWMELSAKEKLVYQRLAEEWSANGPDDDLKPQMAERRAVSWMKAVAQLFWQQCRMPIFIYGCFEDTKAELQGATFDTSLLFESSEEWKGKPTFRSSKDWATDFRRYFYEFFTAYIRPDLASPESMEYLRTTSKRVVEPYEFERTEDGWPLLPEGAGCDTLRRQDILRLFLRELYGFACGREVLSVPWSSLLKSSERFFEPGMLPADFTIGDPSKISREPLKRLFKHIRDIQVGSVEGIPRFQFSHYETGPEGNRQYLAAVNSTDVTPWQPRRSKKKVQPPTFDAPPGHTDAEDEGDDEGQEEAPALSKKTGRGGRFNPGKKFYRDVEKLRKETERARARKKKAEAKAAAKAAKGKAKAGAKRSRKSKGKKKAAVDSEDDAWNSDEAETPEEEEIDDFEAMDNDIPEEESEDSDADPQPPRKDPIPDAASEESDDEVEEALERYEDVLSSSAVRKSASQPAATSRTAGESASAMQQRATHRRGGQPFQVGRSANEGLPNTVVGESPPPDPTGADTEPANFSDAQRGLADGRTGGAAGGQMAPSPSATQNISSAAPNILSNAPRDISAARTIPSALANTTSAVAKASHATPEGGSTDPARPPGIDDRPPAIPTLEGQSKPQGTTADASASSARHSLPHRSDTPPLYAVKHTSNPTASSLPPISAPAAATDAPAAPAASTTSPEESEWMPPTSVDVAPADVPADGSARFRYLQTLDGEKAYLDMLSRGSHLLKQTSSIRVQPPLFWASWGHKSPYLPKDAHTAEKGLKTLQSLIKFLKKGLPATCGSADAQRYCLVMGIALKTVMALQTVEPGEEWPEHLPRYMETSPITFDMRATLLSMCAETFNPPAPDDGCTPAADGNAPAPAADDPAAETSDRGQPSSSVVPDLTEHPTRGKGKQQRGRAGATRKSGRTAAATAAVPTGAARRSTRLRK